MFADPSVFRDGNRKVNDFFFARFERDAGTIEFDPGANVDAVVGFLGAREGAVIGCARVDGTNVDRGGFAGIIVDLDPVLVGFARV